VSRAEPRILPINTIVRAKVRVSRSELFNILRIAPLIDVIARKACFLCLAIGTELFEPPAMGFKAYGVEVVDASWARTLKSVT